MTQTIYFSSPFQSTTNVVPQTSPAVTVAASTRLGSVTTIMTAEITLMKSIVVSVSFDPLNL